MLLVALLAAVWVQAQEPVKWGVGSSGAMQVVMTLLQRNDQEREEIQLKSSIVFQIDEDFNNIVGYPITIRGLMDAGGVGLGMRPGIRNLMLVEGSWGMVYMS